jgi:hypothetical protein
MYLILLTESSVTIAVLLIASVLNRLTPELNPSAQRCLPRWFTSPAIPREQSTSITARYTH